MFKLSDVKTGSQDHIQTTHHGILRNRRGFGYFLDGFIIVVMAVVLFWGATTQFPNTLNDVTRYQCYATAFWDGAPGLASLPKQQCAFLQETTSTNYAQKLQAHHFPAFLVSLVADQSTSQPFHTLPPEYPLLTLIPFSLAFPFPPQWYEIAFAAWMALIAASVYILLKRYRSTGAAIAFAFYLMLGSWATAETRFDLVTAACTLLAVILAWRKHWNWAYVLLAIATLLKFYPIVLLPALFIAQQREQTGPWSSRSRWNGVAVFVAVCAGVLIVSLFLNVADTINPFRYFLNRPIQIESFPATLVWFGQYVGFPVQYPFTFQSQNIISALSSKIGLLSDLLSVAGLLYTFWLQWRGKIDLFVSSLLILLVVMAFGKVLSPQYLIWVAPFVAYVGRGNWKWIISWGCVAALTLYIFPFMYTDLAHILSDYFVIVARDLLILAITLVLLTYAARSKQQGVAPQPQSLPVTGTDEAQNNTAM